LLTSGSSLGLLETISLVHHSLILLQLLRRLHSRLLLNLLLSSGLLPHLRSIILSRLLLLLSELSGWSETLSELHLLLVIRRWHHLLLLLLLYVSWWSDPPSYPHLRLLRLCLLLLTVEINLLVVLLLLDLLGMLNKRVLGLSREFHRLPPH
jgi:hypothetical protein